jgi:hypothetical protein
MLAQFETTDDTPPSGSLPCALWPTLLTETTPDRTLTLLPTPPSINFHLPKLCISHCPWIDTRHIILESVRLGILPWTARWLSSTEQQQLCSGHFFVQEEGEFKAFWSDGQTVDNSKVHSRHAPHHWLILK